MGKGTELLKAYNERRKNREAGNASLSSSRGQELLTRYKQRSLENDLYGMDFSTSPVDLSKYHTQEEMDRYAAENKKRYSQVSELDRKYGDYTSAFNDSKNHYLNNLNALNRASDRYSNFTNSQAYDKAVKADELAQKYKGATYDDIRRALGTATDDDEVNFLKNYTAYDNEDDFRKAVFEAQKGYDKKNKESVARYKNLVNAQKEYQKNNPFNQYKDVLNRSDFEKYSADDTAMLSFERNTASDVTRNLLRGEVPYAESLTGDQRKVAAYYYNKGIAENNLDALGNPKQYMEYMKGMARTARSNEKQSMNEEMNAFADEHPVGAAVLSTGYNAAYGGVNALSDLRALQQGIVDAPSNLGNFASAVDEASQRVGDRIEEGAGGFGGLAKFGYDAVTQYIPNRLRQSLFGGAKGVIDVVMGLDAFSKTYNQRLSEGATTQRALFDSFVNGAAETFTEAIGGEAAFGGDKIAKTGIRSMLKQGGAESLEELGSFLITNVADIVYNQTDSDVYKRYNDYRQQGYSKDEAIKKVAADMGGEILYEMAVAGFSAMPDAGINAIYSSRAGRGVDANNLREAVNALPEDSEVKARLNDLGEGKLSNFAKGQVLREAYGETGENIAEAKRNLSNAEYSNEGVEDARLNLENAQKQRAALSNVYKRSEQVNLDHTPSVKVEDIERYQNEKETPYTDEIQRVYNDNYKGQDENLYKTNFDVIKDKADNNFTLTEEDLAKIPSEAMSATEALNIYKSIVKQNDTIRQEAVKANDDFRSKWTGEVRSGRFEDSTEGHLSKDERAFVEYLKTQSALGYDMRVIKDSSLAKNGMVDLDDNGMITINLAAKYRKGDANNLKQAVATLSHERTHFNRYMLGEEWNGFKDEVKNVMGESAWKKALSQQLSRMKADPENLSDEIIDKAEEEIVAHFSERFTDDEAWVNEFLSKIPQNKVQKFIATIKAKLEQMFSDLNKLMKGYTSPFAKELLADMTAEAEKSIKESIDRLNVRALEMRQVQLQEQEKEEKAEKKETKQETKNSEQVDSDGEKISKAVEKRNEKSVLRDSNGRLKPMYHGSNEKFTTFDAKKFGIHSGDKLKGIWLSDSRDTAYQYGNNIIKSYVNLTNPISLDEVTLKPNDLVKLETALAEKTASGEDYFSDPVKNAKWANDFVNRFESDYEIINAFANIMEADELEDFYKVLKDTLGFDGYVLDRDGETVAVVFSSSQVKDVANENPTDNPDIKLSEQVEDVGYHAGDLGKAESLYQQGSYRGTGHFGTGTYFVGNEEKINSGNYGKRRHEKVNFSKYNLFKPSNKDMAQTLHDFLKIVDGGVEEDWIEHANKLDFNVIDKFEELDALREKETGDWQERTIKAYQKLADKYGIEYDDMDTYLADIGYTDINEDGGIYHGTTFDGEKYEEHYSRTVLDDEYSEYIQKTVDDYIAKRNKLYRKFSDLLFEFRHMKAFEGWEDALRKVVEYQKEHEVGAYNENTSDSYATVFMKALGYEGVDVRHLPSFDNVEFGSVIYDLKDEDLARKQEIGTAKFSDQIDDTDLIAEIFDNTEEVKARKVLKRDEVSRLKRLVKLQGKVTGGKVLDEARIIAVAKELKKMANSDYDLEELTQDIDDAYHRAVQMVHSDEENLDAKIMALFRDVASNILSHQKETVTIDPYFKNAMSEMRQMRVALTDDQITALKEKYGDNWHNALMGKFIYAKDGSNLDSIWSELSDRYPNLFDAETVSPDMGVALIDAYNTAKNSGELTTAYQTAEDLEALTEEVYDKFFTVNAIETVADKYAAERKNLIREHREAMKQLRDSHKKALAKIERRDATIKRVRANGEKKLAEYKKYRDAMEKRQKERSLRRDYVAKIKETSRKMAKTLEKNAVKDPIIEPLKGLVRDFLASIDTSSQQLLGMRGAENKRFTPTKEDRARAESMNTINALKGIRSFMTGEQISEEMKKVRDYVGLSNDELGLSEYFAERWKVLTDSVLDLASKRAGEGFYVLNEMNSTELKTLNDLMNNLKVVVSTANDLVGGSHTMRMNELRHNDIVDLNELGRAREKRKVGHFISEFLNWDNLLPEFAMNHVGKGASIIFNEMKDGMDKEGMLQAEIRKFAEKNFVQDRSTDEKTVKDIVINEGTDKEQRFTMSQAQIMTLYVLYQREQAQSHINNGGIMVRPFARMNGKIVDHVDKHPLTGDEVKYITDKYLTEEQRKRADAMQKWLADFSSKNVNDVTMKLAGIEIADDPHYFPIEVVSSDQQQLSARAMEEGIYKLLNSSFANPLLKEAKNPVAIGSIYDVFIRHASETAKYNSYALPMRDMIKYITGNNYVGNNETESMKTALHEAYGSDAAYEYVIGFLKDLGGLQQAGRGDKYAIVRGYKVAQVAANMQVAALQPISIVRAGLVMDKKYLLGAMASPQLLKHGVETMHENSGISLLKEESTFDINLSRGLNRSLNKKTAYDKVVEASTHLANKADMMTWGTIWNACEIEYKAKHNTNTISEEGMKEVNDRFREIIFRTQVMDSVMTRSALMRSQSKWTQMITSFMSEPTVTYNLVQDAAFKYAVDYRKYGAQAAFARNGKNIAKTVEIYCASAVVEGILRGLFGKWRGKDDDEQPELEYWWSYIRDQLNPLQNVPILRDVLSIKQGYDVSRMDMQPIATAWKAKERWQKAWANGEVDYKTVYSTLQAISQLSGVPISNATREVIDLWNNTVAKVYPSLEVK